MRLPDDGIRGAADKPAPNCGPGVGAHRQQVGGVAVGGIQDGLCGIADADLLLDLDASSLDRLAKFVQVDSRLRLNFIEDGESRWDDLSRIENDWWNNDPLQNEVRIEPLRDALDERQHRRGQRRPVHGNKDALDVHFARRLSLPRADQEDRLTGSV